MRISSLVTMVVAILCSPPATAAPPASYGGIELLRDTWGTPHVFSDTDPGAMYGLGYATAEERAFQMYYALRIIQGRLSELLGDRPSVARPKDSTLDHDRKMRTFGFYRAAKEVSSRLDAVTRALLEAYSAGVNDYVATRRDALHPLFRELGLDPEPWTPADCVVSWWHLGQFFAGDGTRELLHYRNLQAGNAPGRGGRAAPPPQGPMWFDDEAAVVGRADVSDEWVGRVEAFAREKGLPLPGKQDASGTGPKFSHAWVVGGSRTTTGAAVLVSDPQTPVRFPSIWHEFHVSGKTFNARGIGVPGSPGILVGWNENVAWGATAVGADQADLFRLKTDADHPNQYLFDGAWRDMKVRRETIGVKNGAPTDLIVRHTHFGPVITAFAFAAPGDPEVALRRVPVCDTGRETIQALFGMMRATDVNALDRALESWRFPSAHLVFGDRAGNIGYRLAAAVPLRPTGDRHGGAAAIDGTRSDMEWVGFVPPELMPRVTNPKRGWIASANHRSIGSFYPLPLGLSTGSMGHTLRSWRLYERLGERERFEPSDVLSIHYDAVNPARREIVRIALHARDTLKRELSADASQALALLRPWQTAGAASDFGEPGAALAGEINTFFRIVNTPLAAKYGGGETGLARFLRDVGRRLTADATASLGGEELAYIDSALASAWQSAQQKFGDAPDAWDGRAREQVRSQRLGAFDSLDGFGPLGDESIPVPPLATVDGGTIRSQAGQSYTQYVPLHDVDAALSLLPPGHGEKPDDPMRTSTAKAWASGTLHPAPLSRAAIEKIAARKTQLGVDRQDK